MQYFRLKEKVCPAFFICLTLPSEVNDQPKKVQKNEWANGLFGLDKKLALVDNFAQFTQETQEIQSLFYAKSTFYLGAN